MPVKLIVHPHYVYGTNAVFCDRANTISQQENAFVIVDPRYPSYVQNPKNPPLESITGSLDKKLADKVLEDRHVLMMGGIHGKCPYDTLNSILIAFVLRPSSSLIVDFPLDFIYCKVENIGNTPYLHIGETAEDIEGEWTLHIAHEKGERGRKRVYPSEFSGFIPIGGNRYVYDSGSYLLSTALMGPEIPIEDVFRAYITLVNLWSTVYATSLLRRVDPERKLGIVQLKYATGFERQLNSFTIDLTKTSTPLPH